MTKIFVSYARDESKKVYYILDKLREYGIEFWVDVYDIENGKDWAEEISKAIANCKKVLLFMSRLSMASSNTAQEVKIAYVNRKKFAVLRLDDVKYPTKLKYALEGIQWTDYPSKDWDAKIAVALGGGKKSFKKRDAPMPSRSMLGRPARPTRLISPQMPNAQSLVDGLVHAFSEGGRYHEDECKAALVKLDDLTLVAAHHWINPALAFKELVPRQFLLDKIEVIRGLILDFQDTCPPGSSIKRQLILDELRLLSQELSP